MPTSSIPTRTTPRDSRSFPSSGPSGACAAWRRRISPIRRSSTRSFATARCTCRWTTLSPLALENNLDIAIQRYNLITADVDILRTSSGSAALGVNTGLVQGTPGGTPGSTARAEPAPQPLARPAAARAARPLAWAERPRAQRASSPRPRAKVRRSTTSIRSLRAPVRNNTRSRRPPTFSLALRR